MTQAVSPQMHSTICKTLAQIARDEQITILFAAESGSRAWGFHSHDSDYDVRFVYARPVSWHLRLGEKQQTGLRLPDGAVKLKRYLYTIRPVLALRYMRLHDTAMAPMNMTELMGTTDLPEQTTRFINTMIATKLELGELGTADRTNPAIDALIAQELAAVQNWLDQDKTDAPQDHWALADDLHQRFTRQVPDESAMAHGPRR